jgi:hypothetical protein
LAQANDTSSGPTLTSANRDHLTLPPPASPAISGQTPRAG